MFSSNGSQVASNAANYIEDVFSPYLYKGNSSTQTITNGIDLAGKGGLVWLKRRSSAGSHFLQDSARGISYTLSSDTTGVQVFNDLTSSFNSNGFGLYGYDDGNLSGQTFVSWTFRKQPKFFDVVTYTGNGSNQTISHSLGSAPGCIIVKCTSNGTTNWFVYHSSLAVTSGRPGYMYLDSTSAVQTGDPTVWPSIPTSTTFEVGSYNALNGSGRIYVAYLFAHNAGGFGLTGTDNVISCGSLTCGSGISTATLGYEPQWLLIKGSNNANAWWLVDNMRGLSQSGYNRLIPNDSSAETAITSPYISITSTGFTMDGSIFGNGNSFVYIAIRRGPMKVPTSGTSVFSPIAQTTAAPTTVTTNFPVDLELWRYNRTSAADVSAWDRLRGGTQYLYTPSTQAETTGNPSYSTYFDSNTTFRENFAGSGQPAIFWSFRRAPSFFDEVCYTGTWGVKAVNHNLGVVPELMIFKERNNAQHWAVYSAATGVDKTLYLSTEWGAQNGSIVNSTAPTSTVFTLSGSGEPLVNAAGGTYVAYLFATCAGVSKVFSFTGNGSSQTIGCGFTAGARFVMIKRTDSTGDWYVWDTARGIVSGNDPHLSLNTTAAEVTTDDTIDPDSSGFIVNQLAATNCNVNGATYIGLAIA